MKDILIYTTHSCPYCTIAKRALDNRGIPYREEDITLTPQVRDELYARTGERTVPQVFVDGIYIGQDDELVEMAESGALDPDVHREAPAAAEGETWDVVIIGAGRSGLTAARALAGCGRVLVVDRAPWVGGADPARGALRRKAEQSGAAFQQKEAFGIESGDGAHALITLDEVIRTRLVVVATGASDRLPSIPGEAALAGKGVSRCAECDGSFFTGQPVAVAGGNERAAHAAVRLSETASRVDLLCPEPEPSLCADTFNALASTPNLTVHAGARVTAVTGEGQVSGITYEDASGSRPLTVSGVFFYLTGDRPGTAFLHGAAETGPEGELAVNALGETTLDGVFAVGKAAGQAPSDTAALLPKLVHTITTRVAG